MFYDLSEYGMQLYDAFDSWYDGLLDLDASCIQNKLIFINTMEYCLWLAVFADCCLEYVRVPVFFVIPTKMPPLDLNKTEGLLPCPNSLKKKIVRLRLLN